jgi:hypothetical protein
MSCLGVPLGRPRLEKHTRIDGGGLVQQDWDYGTIYDEFLIVYDCSGGTAGFPTEAVPVSGPRCHGFGLHLEVPFHRMDKCEPFGGDQKHRPSPRSRMDDLFGNKAVRNAAGCR